MSIQEEVLAEPGAATQDNFNAQGLRSYRDVLYW